MMQQIFRGLADLRFAILILLVISLCSIIGTVIEQEQSIEIYKQTYPLSHPVLGFISWDRILQFGLDHVYKTWWFLTLIFLFGLSLILCSFFQQLPSLKIARRCQFFRTTAQFYRLKISTIFGSVYFNKITSRLKRTHYSMFQQKNVVYCYRGLVGQIAPIIVHFSMILILIGTIFGALFGFKSQERVTTSETFHIQNILTNGFLTQIPNTTARVNNFWITYTKQKTVSQFYSDLSILDKVGTEIVRQTISVNFPLTYKSIYYYQTDWSLLGLQFYNFSDKPIEYPLSILSTQQDKVWLTWISTNELPEQSFFLIVDNLEGYCSVYNQTGKFFGNIELNERTKFTKPIALSQIISSTGLQIKKDPGLSIIYSGFLFLMFSTSISYLTYSQIWIVMKGNQIFVGGTTNRANFEFELEFLNFAKMILKQGVN